MNSKEEIHKGNQFKKIFKTGSWYFIGSLLTKATGFFLLPVYTRYLSPADYGVLNSLNSIANLLPIFISLYIDSAFGRYYFSEKKVSDQRVQILYSTLFWFICIWGIVVVIASLFLSPVLIQPLLKVPFLPYIPLIMIPTLFGQLSLLGSVFLRSNLKAKEITILNFIVFICVTGITLMLLINYKMGIRANLYAAAIGSIISLIFFIYISIKYNLLRFTYEWKTLWTSLLFSLPLIPNIASGWIGGLSDRLIMAYYGKIEQVGLYSVSAQFALILYMINDAITQVQGPIALSALTDNRVEGKKQISQFISLFIWFILICYLLITLFSKEVLYVMTEKRFHSAYELVAVLAFLYVMSGIYRIFTTILSFHGKMWVISSAAIVSAFLSMILNLIFIPHFGQWAAAWASFFSVLGYTIWLFLWSQKYEKLQLNYPLIILCFTLTLIIVFLNIYINKILLLTLGITLIIKFILIVLYIIPVLFLPFMTEIRSALFTVVIKFLKLFK